MATTAIERPKPIFSPLALGLFLIAICLMAWVSQEDIHVPTGVLLAIIGGSSLAILVTGLMRPEIPLLALAAYLPFSRVLVGGFSGFAVALNLTNVLMIIVVMGHVLQTLAQHRPLFERSAMNVPTFLFCVLGSISLIRGMTAGYAPDYASTFIIPLKRWLTPVMLYFLTFNIVRDRLMVRRLLVIMMIVVTVAALMAIKEYIDIGPNSSLDSSRVGGIAEQPNMLGAFFVYYMFLFAGFWVLRWKKAAYWLLLIPFAFCFRGIMVTFSRGAYLAFAVGALALAFFRNKLLCLIAIAFCVLAVINPSILPPGIAYRLEMTLHPPKPAYVDAETNLSEQLDASSANRLKIWGGAMRMIQDHPWGGVGYGVFPFLIQQYEPSTRLIDTHNSYLLIATEMGIPALLVFLWIVFLMLGKSRWLYRHAADPFFKAMALGWLAGLYGLLIANMFGSRLFSEEVSSYFWMLCALVMRALVIERQTQLVGARSSATSHRRQATSRSRYGR